MLYAPYYENEKKIQPFGRLFRPFVKSLSMCNSGILANQRTFFKLDPIFKIYKSQYDIDIMYTCISLQQFSFLNCKMFKYFKNQFKLKPVNHSVTWMNQVLRLPVYTVAF